MPRSHELVSLRTELERCGAIKNGRVVLQGCLTIPVLDEAGTVVNVVGYKLSRRAKRPLVTIGEDGIFNAPFLSKQREVIFVESPLDALTLIQYDFAHTTFPFGSDAKYLKFAQDQGIRAVTFTFEGRARLFAGPLRLERPSADRERPDPDHRCDREAAKRGKTRRSG